MVAVVLPLLVGIEHRAAQPMIPPSLFADRQLAVTYVLTAAAGFGMGSVVFLTSIATLAYGVPAESRRLRAAAARRLLDARVHVAGGCSTGWARGADPDRVSH